MGQGPKGRGLDTITVTDPTTGSTTTSAGTGRITYDTTGSVTTLADASNNTTTFCYNYDLASGTCTSSATGTTRVDVHPPSGGLACPTCTPVQSWVQTFDTMNRDTGVITSDLGNPTGSHNYRTAIAYADASDPIDPNKLYNPQRPRVITDQAGRSTKIRYDVSHTISDGGPAQTVSYGNVAANLYLAFGCDGMWTGQTYHLV
jgi:hypothetical protein